MKIRHYEESDYDTLVNWYNEWELPVTPKNHIPEIALIVEDGEDKVCSGFLYQLGNTTMYWIEGIITNPNIESEKRKKAMDMMIKAFTVLAKYKGGDMLISSTPRAGLKSIFSDNSFGEAPEQYYHVARRL